MQETKPMKEFYRKKVFDYVKQNGICSRSQIANAIGVSSPTVLKITGFLIEEGLLIEGGESEPSVGRKAQLLRINKNRYFAIGVLVEGVYVRVGLVNLANEVIMLNAQKTSGGLKEILTEILPNMINDLITKSKVGKEQVLGVGIGLPCTYNAMTHQVRYASLVSIADSSSIREYEEELSVKCGLRILVDNDVNMQVYGEYRYRHFTDEDLIYISVGTGLGAGIFLNGQLRLGSSYQCGEIGYMVFDEKYVAEVNKPGWLETKINLRAMDERFAVSDSNDTMTDYFANKVALCIANINALLDCKLVCLDGILVDQIGNHLIDRVHNRLVQYAMNNVSVERPLCAHAGVVGAATRIIEQDLDHILEA